MTLPSSISKNIAHPVLFSVSMTIILVSLFSSIEVRPQIDYITTQHEQEKAEIQSSINNINSVLQERGAALVSITERKNTLQAEIQAREQNIQELNDTITEAKLAEAQLQDQIEKNETKRDELYAQMELLIPEIQKESRKTGLQTIIESKNVGDLMRRLFGLSSFQVELENIDQELEQINKTLEENRRQQEEVRLALENSVFLLRSEQDGLQILLEETQGEEAQYQALIADLNAQRQAQEAEVAQLEAQYQADIARIQAEQAAAAAAAAANNSNNSGSSSSGGGSGSTPVVPGNCPFEDGRNLGVVLGSPTTGFISDNFGCPSWTGRWHDGYDIANALGTPITASYGGVVERKGFEAGGFGHYVFLRHSTGSVTFYTLYAHMNVASPIGVGSVVGQGAQIGTMGSTGWSTGPHLHYMILSDSYSGSLGCVYGGAKCFNPGLYTSF
jgi:murein DD-endopeptidase MepM/ murein hydrolase activator NlpD